MLRPYLVLHEVASVQRDVEPEQQLQRRAVVKQPAALDVGVGPPIARLQAPEHIEDCGT